MLISLNWWNIIWKIGPTILGELDNEEANKSFSFEIYLGKRLDFSPDLKEIMNRNFRTGGILDYSLRLYRNVLNRKLI